MQALKSAGLGRRTAASATTTAAAAAAVAAASVRPPFPRCAAATTATTLPRRALLMASSRAFVTPSTSPPQRPCGGRRRRPLSGRAPATALPPGLGGGGPELPTPVDPLPPDLRIEPDPDAGAKKVSYDEATNTVKIPLKMVAEDGEGGGGDPASRRRTKLVMFTCKPCGHRSARLVNPLAWEKGLVFGQCQHCGVWHTLASNNPNIYEEIRFDKADAAGAAGAGAASPAAAASAAASASASSEASDQTAAGGGASEAGDGASSSV